MRRSAIPKDSPTDQFRARGGEEGGVTRGQARLRRDHRRRHHRREAERQDQLHADWNALLPEGGKHGHRRADAEEHEEARGDRTGAEPQDLVDLPRHAGTSPTSAGRASSPISS
jgi:hypothetical protein